MSKEVRESFPLYCYVHVRLQAGGLSRRTSVSSSYIGSSTKTKFPVTLKYLSKKERTKRIRIYQDITFNLYKIIQSTRVGFHYL